MAMLAHSLEATQSAAMHSKALLFAAATSARGRSAVVDQSRVTVGAGGGVDVDIPFFTLFIIVDTLTFF